MCAIINIRLKKGGDFAMIVKNRLKMSLKNTIFGLIFAILAVFMPFSSVFVNSQAVYAEPETSESTEENEENAVENEGSTEETNENTEQDETEQTEGTRNSGNTSAVTTGDNCQSSLGMIGWLVCPTTGKIAEAVDWLYDKIESILIVNPISFKEGTPIYEVWKYCRGITNIVFIIFLLVVIYSQITGVGISNYGVKKALPKLIIAAILVNLSFLICTLAVDLSNIVGKSLRDVFTTVQENVVLAGTGMTAAEADISSARMFSSLAGGTALAVGAGVVAFEFGAIWMLIPVLLGALVAVVTGLITIALRQAVVMLLIMISPLAMVAYILPNTEKWFNQWRDLLYKMLIFYPAFSLLFGASSLAGFAIIASATSGFGIILGVAVQIFPLFFSWKLMQMSGTFLGNINAGLRGLAARPLAANRAWAESHRNLTRQRTIEEGRTPSAHLMRFLNNRKIAREAAIKDSESASTQRGLEYYRGLRYRKDGSISREGERVYARQAKMMGYERSIQRDDNNLNLGYGAIKGAARDGAQASRLMRLDKINTAEADYLKIERARGEKIDYENAVGFHNRTEDAYNNYLNRKHEGEKNYAVRDMVASTQNEARDRFDVISNIMEGDMAGIQYAGATAAHLRSSYQDIIQNKMKAYFNKTVPTESVMLKLEELARQSDVMNNIDYVIPGLRELNIRGDTDKAREIIERAFESNGGGVELGTHASQSIMGFVQFDMGNSDPFMKKFGKHINVQTAKVYDNGERKNKMTSLDEYVKGYYYEEGSDEPVYIKTGIENLIKGVSLDAMERTALPNLEAFVKKAYTTKNSDGTETFNQDAYLNKMKGIRDSMMPAFISSTMKYPSGSEALLSEVKFLTGLEQKPTKDENGRVILDKNGEPEMEWVAAWDGLEGEEREKLRDYYINNATKYLGGSTPQQILGLRSDFNNPFAYLFAMDYLDSDSDDVDEENNKNNYRERMQNIMNENHFESDVDLLNSSAGRKLLEEIRSDDAMRLLSDRGMLNHFKKMSERSSAVSGSKDWVREMLNLDPGRVDRLNKSIKLEKRKQEAKYRANNPSQNEPGSNNVSNDAILRMRQECRRALESLWNSASYRLEDNGGDYYAETKAMLESTFGQNSREVFEYNQFYNDIMQGRATVDDLRTYLDELLNNDVE